MSSMTQSNKEKMIQLMDDNLELLPNKIHTIYDIASSLGLCSYADMAIDLDIPLETVMYSTPKMPIDYVGEPDSLLVFNFTTTSNNSLEFESVDLEPFSTEDIYNHMYHRKDTSNDLSLTQRSSGDDLGDLFERSSRYKSYSTVYATLFGWVEEADDALQNNPDWLDALLTIDYQDQQWARLERECRNVLSSNGGEFEGFVSVTIDGDNPADLTDYMDTIQKIVWEDKKENNDVTSVGESIDYVSQTEGSVLGVNGNSDYPWDYQTSKITEQYPQVNPEKGWRHKPISLDTALLMSEGSSILDDLNVSTVYGKNGIVIDQFIVPFTQGEYTADELYSWYDQIQRYRDLDINEFLKQVYPDLNEFDEDVASDIFGEDVYDINDPIDTLYISVQVQGKKNTEAYSFVTTRNHASEVHEAVKNIITNKLRYIYTGSNGLISPDINIHQTTATLFNPSWYVDNICGRDRDQEQRGPNSIEYQIVRALLGGEPVSYQELVRSFTIRQEFKYHDFDRGSESYSESQEYLKIVAQQHLVINLLRELNLISEDLRETAYDRRYMSESNGVDTADFLEEHSHINGTEAQYPYLLGTVVGELSYHQTEKNDISTPAYMQYPVDYISKNTYMDVVSDIINKVLQYHSKDNLGHLLGYDLNDLEVALSEDPPEEFGLSESEMRYYYSLGLVNGLTYSE